MECILQRTEAPKDGIKRNVWYTMGEFDGLGCSLEGDNANTRTLAMICEANGMDATKQKHYTNGIYMNTIIRDENAVPMVRFTGVSNWPHTYSPELAFAIYDEFSPGLFATVTERWSISPRISQSDCYSTNAVTVLLLYLY